MIYLDASKPIPVHEGFAFLRYEKTLPKFERELGSKASLLNKEYSYLAAYSLDMQQALLGRVTPALRYIGIDANPEKKKLVAQFIYNGEISELDSRLAAAAIQDSRASFPDYVMETYIERVDYPTDFVVRGKLLAYWRREWIYQNNERIPAIHK